MPIAAFAAGGLAFFCSGVFCKMSKEDRIIEIMTETHEQHLEQLEEKMERFIESREVEFSNAEHEKSRVKIRNRIERYLDWYEDKVRQVEDSFQDRVEKRLKARRENMRN
jgi:TRAP-type C4-dicarboxylate transport system substrate-binding protein